MTNPCHAESNKLFNLFNNEKKEPQMLQVSLRGLKMKSLNQIRYFLFAGKIIRRIQHKLAGVGAFLPERLCPLIFGRGFRCILYGVCIRILSFCLLASEFLFFPLLALFILKKRRNSFRLFISKR
ncbi:MAG: hypothetical protein A2Z38_00310 [Planctomycetes bacterium RBG_19FT_COMBO_48_8]|nr:MAG: hypothetical protein A2Z38_00310 [Planctomycetes bacterium RBG_19FT_COMBO_48_8]